MAAFVITGSAFTPAAAPSRGAFAGAAVSPRAPAAVRSAAAASPRMAAYSLDKYNKMSGGDAAPPAVAGPQGMSGGYRAYLDSVKAAKGDSYRASRRAAAGGPSPSYATAAVLAGGSPFFYLQGAATAAKFGKGGDATTDVVPGGRTGAAADKYMAQCVRTQYKATAVPTGVVRWSAGGGEVRRRRWGEGLPRVRPPREGRKGRGGVGCCYSGSTAAGGGELAQLAAVRALARQCD